MAKILVALLATLALAAPAMAQDPGSPQGSDPEPAPEQPSGNQTGGSPPPQQQSSSASSPQQTAENTSAPYRVPCPLVRSNVGDPSIPKSQWVMVDPNGCFQTLVYRILNYPPAGPVRKPF